MEDSPVETGIQLTVERSAKFAGTRLLKALSMQRSLHMTRLDQLDHNSKSFRPISCRIDFR
jgi:hypothetical protein